MKLFSKKFLDELQVSYISDLEEDFISLMMRITGMDFHDTILLLAKKKGLEPEYCVKLKEQKQCERKPIWYRLKDVLPIKSEYYLTYDETLKFISTHNGFKIMKYYGGRDKKFWCYETQSDGNVSHWMPLPELPL